jgi:hypothetical protein
MREGAPMTSEITRGRTRGWWLGALLVALAAGLLLLPVVEYQVIRGMSNDGTVVTGVGYQDERGARSEDVPLVSKGDSLGSAVMELQESAARNAANARRIGLAFWPAAIGAFLLGRGGRRPVQVPARAEA